MEIIFHTNSWYFKLCSELMHHFREIFNVTFGVPNFVADGEIHATCLASILPDNS